MKRRKRQFFFFKGKGDRESVMDGYGFFPHLVNIQSNHLVLSKADPSKWSTPPKFTSQEMKSAMLYTRTLVLHPSRARRAIEN